MSTNKNETRFVYVRQNKRPVTIAYRFNDERGVVEYNYALCGKRDNFSKKIGRAVATGRLNTDSVKSPNSAVSYDMVSEDGKPRYNLIAAHLYFLFSEN